MVKITGSKVTIGGRVFNKDKSSYPMLPTVYTGVEVVWGADACIDHPEPSRATISLWIPKTHEAWVPALGDVVKLDAVIAAGGDLVSDRTVGIFAGKVEAVKLQDDHKPALAPIIPNSVGMTNISSYNIGRASAYAGPYTTINSSVTVSDDTLTIPFASGTNYIRTTLPDTPVSGDRTYALSFSTSSLGTSVVRFRYFNASNTQLSSGSAYAYDNRYTFTPPTGTTKVSFDIDFAFGTGVTSFTLGKFLLGTDSSPGYRVNVVAADALAEAARLRLSSDGYMPYENVLNRQARLATMATAAGVTFNSGLTEEQGYYEALDTYVAPRDMDSFPALEAFQRATMAAGHTVISADNVVQPSVALKLPQILSATQPASATYGYSGTISGDLPSTHTLTSNGTVTRTNWASNATGTTLSGIGTSTFYGYYAGGGTAFTFVSNVEGPKNGTNTVGAQWSGASVSGQKTGIYYKQTSISGPVSGRVSGGAWVKSHNAKTGKLTITALSGGVTSVGTASSATVSLPAETWQWVAVNGITTTAAYDAVEVAFTVNEVMSPASTDMLHMDGILIEKTATAGAYFDMYTLDPAAVVIPIPRPGVPVIPASAIVDDVFEIDTSKVVNEIKVELKYVNNPSSTPPGFSDYDQVFTDAAATKKTTPQTRNIDTDWGVSDFYYNIQDGSVATVMVTKAKLLLAGQSKPTWRLSSALSVVMDQLATQESLDSLLLENERFGSLIRITGAPPKVPEYMRVRGGRIVLGETPVLEFDLEPVEYSAPIPLTGTLLQQDYVASNFKLKNAKSLTFSQLRSIGAR